MKHTDDIPRIVHILREDALEIHHSPLSAKCRIRSGWLAGRIPLSVVQSALIYLT